MDRLPVFHVRHVQIAGWGVLALACAGLMTLGIWPSYAFPLVWLAPLALMTSLQMVSGEKTIFSATPRGDWKSLAHWEYAIPFVHQYKVFEMPLLGYVGYLPFGLECLAVAQFLFPRHNIERLTTELESRSQVKNLPLTGDGLAMSGESFAEESSYFKV